MTRFPPHQSPHPRRRGFTLIEILVVVTILIILIALLVPAVQTSMRTVRITAIQTDIGVIASAVTAFKTKYGTEPPSRVILFEQPSDWALPANASHRALIRQFWPQFDFTQPRDLDGDGNSNEVHELTSGECLVFFLGGMPSAQTGGFSLIPFTKNPTDPFSRNSNANRDKPSYEFNSIRLTDINNNGFPEYKDPYPGQTRPYLYYSTYDGAGYRATGKLITEAPSPPGTNEFTGGYVLVGAQLVQNEQFPSSPYLNGSTISSEPFNPRSFQIISPGPDGKYGPGGPYVAGSKDPLPNWVWNPGISTPATPPIPRTYTMAPDERAAERDNVTNFGSGMLAP